MQGSIELSDEHVILSKKERSEARKQHNAKWKQSIRLLSNAANVEEGTLNDPNPRHSLYYSMQLAPLFAKECNDDKQKQKEAWDLFQRTLAMPMPVTFRAGGSCPFIVQQAMQRVMSPRGQFHSMTGRYIEAYGKVLRENIIRHVKWLNSNNSSAHTVVYQAAVDATTLSHTDGLAPLSAYLQREVALGGVVRQELASMIPGCLLDLQSHHTVLDVCAAPGSKTEQLLAMMSRHAPNGIPSGMVVANDADQKRIHTLRERYARACVPHMLIVNSRAEDLQAKVAKTKRRNLKDMMKALQNDAKAASYPVTYRQVLDTIGAGEFDRIVCDVPCSGDGTIRKFPHIWRLFRPRVALELHCIQLQIAIASVLMLKPGGRMVYSTCSLNPLEDEAVVCALLRYFNIDRKHLGKNSERNSCRVSTASTAGGGVKLYQTQYSERMWPLKNYSLRLVNVVPELLPDLRAHEGLTQWQYDKPAFVNRAAEADDLAYQESLARVPAIPSTTYPPSPEEIPHMNLSYCRRIMPQDMDSGGFFVAVLELVEVPDMPIPPSASKHSQTKANEKSYSTGDTGYGDPSQALLSTQEQPSDKKEMSGLNNKISATAAVSVMSRLGYNPTVAGASSDKKSAGRKRSRSDDNKSKNSAADDQDSINMHTRYTYRDLSPAEANRVEQCVHISMDAGNDSVSLAETTATTILPKLAKGSKHPKEHDTHSHKQQKTIFGSRAQGWAKEETPAEEKEEEEEEGPLTTVIRTYSILSKSVKQALTGWAKPSKEGDEDPDSAGGTAGKKGSDRGSIASSSSSEPRVIHAGVNIAGISNTKELAVLDTALLAMRPFLIDPPSQLGDYGSGSGSGGGGSRIHTIDLNAKDFHKFAKTGRVRAKKRLATTADSATTVDKGNTEKGAAGSGGGSRSDKECEEVEESAYRARVEREQAEDARDNALQDMIEAALYADDLDDDDEDGGGNGEEGDIPALTARARRMLQEWYLHEVDAFEAAEAGRNINNKTAPPQQKLQFLYLRLPVSASTTFSTFKSSTTTTTNTTTNTAHATASSDSGAGSGRRLSKAEKKRMKAGVSVAPSVPVPTATSVDDVDAGAGVDSQTARAGGCAVLALQYSFISSSSSDGDPAPVFSWISSGDTCESFAFALS